MNKRILKNASIVVTYGEAHRKARLVVSQTRIPVIRCLALQSRMINTAATKTHRESCLRIGVAVVCGNSKPAEQAGQEGKALFPGRFKARDVSVGTVNGLIEKETS